jgi:hypothetical protein
MIVALHFQFYKNDFKQRRATPATAAGASDHVRSPAKIANINHHVCQLSIVKNKPIEMGAKETPIYR